ncbi:putative mitochondrial protein AtMg00310 [Apium graveolens]|uniref:putative mitochondrial protein AtMg00310 n=1 Tax=Apium graveolens TaxID=4045 RepID=UPI003D79B6F8
MTEANEHSTYLDLPNIIGRNKSALLGYLKDKVDTKIRSWEGNYLSYSGKEILVKQLAQTMPTYAMNVFLLPLEITRSIERCLTKFWWNSSEENSSKLNWMSWDRLAKHKNAGGMGFRHFRDFNVAMLGEQLWHLITNPQILVSRLYKAKYFANTDLFQAELGHNPIFIWRSLLLEAKPLLIEGSRWRVEDGKHIPILGQPWLVTEENSCITSNPKPLQNQMVASLMCTDKECGLEVVKDVLNERDQDRVLAVPISNSNQEDKL